MDVGQLSAQRAIDSTGSSPFISADSKNDKFVGDVMQLKGVSNDLKSFNFIQASTRASADASSETNVFKVSSTGDMFTRGGAAIGGKLDVRAGAVLGGEFTMPKVTISAGEV